MPAIHVVDTDCVTVAMFSQPFPSVPITVYVVVVVGVTAMVGVVALLLQVYVVAPPAVITTARPLHTVPTESLVAVTIGKGFTVNV